MIVTLDSTIQDLFEHRVISVRTYHGLHYNGFNTLRDVQTAYPDLTGLLSIRNFGKKSLFELTEVFKYVIKTDDEKIESSDFKQVFYQKFQDLEVFPTIEGIICDTFESHFIVESTSLSILKETHSSGVSLFYNIFSDVQYFFKVYPSLTYNENLEIRKVLFSFINSILEQLKGLDVGHKHYKFRQHLLTPLSELYNTIKDKVEYFSDVDKFTYFFTPIQKELFEKEFLDELRKSSIRTRNVVKKYLNNIVEVVGLIEDPIHSLSKSKNIPAIISGNSRTNLELTQMLLRLKDKFDNIFKIENKEIQMLSIKKTYPFLVNSQRLFVIDHLNKYGYLPHFYILYNYLRATSNDIKSFKIFTLYYGILTGTTYTLEEIKDEVGLSFERVRQLKSKGIKVDYKFINFDPANYAHILEKPFFFSDDVEYLQILERERLNISFISFVGLLSAIGSHSLVKLKEAEVVQKNNLFKDNSLQKIIDNIISSANKKKSIDKSIKISSLIHKKSCAKKDLLIRVLERINNPNLEISDNEIILRQNHIDPKIESINILEEQGTPMFLHEIFDIFKRKFPNHKFDSAERLRTYMTNPIIAIGRQSRYALDGWGYNYNSINELLYDIVSKSNVPLHINNIFDEVLKYFPKTTIRSVENTMAQDDLERFIIFTNGFYGIEGKSYPQNFIKSNIVRRYTFEQRLQMFKDFIESYKRFPLSSGGEIESSLYRWYYNLSNNVLDVTAEQLELFNRLIQQCEKSYIPRTGFEIEFLNNCLNYKSFIKDNHILPNRDNGTELYYWLIRSKENFNSYTDYRRIYFTDLLSYIASFGFNI